jgi:hypothetical protein
MKFPYDRNPWTHSRRLVSSWTIEPQLSHAGQKKRSRRQRAIVVNFGLLGLIEENENLATFTVTDRSSGGAGLVGAVLMILVDHGGTVWLKFALYAIFFSAIFLAAVLSPVKSCGWSFLRRQPKT